MAAAQVVRLERKGSDGLAQGSGDIGMDQDRRSRPSMSRRWLDVHLRVTMLRSVVVAVVTRLGRGASPDL
jgi:hypothetical protein